jgi:A/G-specific adenine glycosylase
MSRSSAPDRRKYGPPLVRWFAQAGRDLPWRSAGPRDPYRVWISEAMLQQTRVATVIDYYGRFVTRFPDVHSLAKASEEEVLQLWSGLGYYRRARLLHAGARAVVERHGGSFPATRAELEALPGIGPYTAGAIASLAFDAPEPLVDGNVERVFARLFRIEAAQASAELRRRSWELARVLCPEQGAGAWNEALMELGALICTPREPRCELCPLAAVCEALHSGRAKELPLPRQRPEPFAVELEVLCARAGGRLLFCRRPEGGRMAGLWELPTRECVPAGMPTRLYPDQWDARLCEQRLRCREHDGKAGGEPIRVRHSITCHRIRATLVAGELDRIPKGEDWQWRTLAEAPSLGLTGMARKFVRSMERAQREQDRASKKA